MTCIQQYCIFCKYFLGVLLAILEKLEYILPVIGEDGKTETLNPGSVAAGYQNFLICIEMFLAAIALRYAFPISVYLSEGCMNAEGTSASVTMQSISSSLKVFKAGTGFKIFILWRIREAFSRNLPIQPT